MKGEIRRKATQAPLTRPDDGAASQAGKNADQDNEAGLGGEGILEAGHDQRAGDAGERHHGALRQVEPADDEDEHLARGDDDKIGRAAQHIEEVLHRHEVRNEQRERDEQYRHQDGQETGSIIGSNYALEN